MACSLCHRTLHGPGLTDGGALPVSVTLARNPTRDRELRGAESGELGDWPFGQSSAPAGAADPRWRQRAHKVLSVGIGRGLMMQTAAPTLPVRLDARRRGRARSQTLRIELPP